MAFLWWNSSVRNIGPAISGIGELKFLIENALRDEMGFRDVASSPLDVAGNKDGVRVSIAHFQKTPSSFWELVIAAGDTEQTKATNDAVVEMLKKIKVL
ncbi:hypothetical protein ONA91_14945 [Micromonospora sp. DR5-3]|uniref:hypothetical protein n=1 Tax=unclassified Micromonospora TaxID=2617518 RepID=UPI0011D5E160|nr:MULTISPECIES: hypothetical protein [unclassified Micromonospora]MCW3815748.1 hypothetical protein [Micromonospora sp. DR5-3]TYC19671.1 hypothetical protein FXF52_35390 [Micromonospora sp. MP36]